MTRSYQRRYLRAPYKETTIYADGPYVFRAKTLNISEDGLLLSELPSFPEQDDVPLLLRIPKIPVLKNFPLVKLQTFSAELFPAHVIRARARIARRGELSQSLDNIFKTSFGLQFSKIGDKEQKAIADYVSTFSSNITTLQTLIDSYNSDETARARARALAAILGYDQNEKIARLRLFVEQDYRSLQWL